MEASRIPKLIKDLKEPTTRTSQKNEQAQPARHHAPNRNQSHQDSMNDEWRTFVNDPSAYFNLFNTSTASIIVIGGITLLSFLLILLATIFFSALAIVVIAITIAVSIFSISVPVLGWIVGALLFLSFGAWLLDFFAEAFESFQERIKSRLVATAYPHKTLLVAWGASNFMSLVAYTADVNFGLFVVYFIVNNLCFIAMYEELSALLKRLEKEYDNIRSRQTDTAISIRSQTTFRDFYK